MTATDRNRREAERLAAKRRNPEYCAAELKRQRDRQRNARVLDPRRIRARFGEILASLFAPEQRP